MLELTVNVLAGETKSVKEAGAIANEPCCEVKFNNLTDDPARVV